MEAGELKTRIESFLSSAGVEYDARRKKFRCPNPSHADEHASAHLYRDTNLLYCPVCSASWDVFDVAGLLGAGNDFPARKRYVEERLGVPADAPGAGAGRGASAPKAGRPPKSKPVPLDRDKARDVYARAEIERRAEMAGWGTIAGSWPFLDAEGRVMAVDVRFERPAEASGKSGPGKAVVTFWYDGGELRTQGAPVLLYGLDQLKARPNDPVLVVEGCKTAEAAAKIPGFVVVTWNGGTGKAVLADWSPLEGRTVTIWPDDDAKADANGQIKPLTEQPGIKAALAIREKLPHARIITPPPEARKIKTDGADAVEALAVMSPDEVAAYLATAAEAVPLAAPENTRPKPARDAAKNAERQAKRDEARRAREAVEVREHNPAGFPFVILGVEDHGMIAAIGRGDRFVVFSPQSLTKTSLLTLAPLQFWQDEFGYQGHDGGVKVPWDAVISYVVGIGVNRDFDDSTIRGRGAWREKDGRLCYHDGLRTIGENDARRLYVRRPRRDIGIEGPELSGEVAKEIEATTSCLSFETPLDHVRVMGWALLAPFAGALPWRPAILLTGDSGSGKTTIIDFVVSQFASPLQVSGGESTEAGVRQRVGIDACGVVVDEAECDTEKKRRNREALFSLMRQSTSDDAPIVAKGTIDGRGFAFQMRSMFLFAAISPDIQATADDNRIFRCNLTRPDSTKWPRLREELRRLVTCENCAKLRARIWNRLPAIIATTHRFAGIIQDVSGRDARYSLAEAELQAAYWIGLRDRDLSDAEFREQLAVLYSSAPVEVPRNENEELLDKILDSTVQLDEPRRAATLREVLLGVRDGKSRLFSAAGGQFDDPDNLNPGQLATLRAVAGRYGLGIVGDNLAVSHNNDAIMKILDRGRGYHRQILRHDGVVEQSKTIWLAGKARRAVLLRGEALGEQPEPPPQGPPIRTAVGAAAGASAGASAGADY